ncbi:CDP-alcohol phosphatidyltransferase family protein [Croceicoccus sp. YJ47]|uniref:CDP-alcohol phosphatidyltransferase family protein n=1 Tax=Croceicoccus sp. YJ47 TaxID=2798724 RepID=UPI0019211F61|nr:CDP-alcohol phosphatidyltransferase family protein [Croceicoccus sp. YJ47]QQN74307.1 CDP-alcohol phosphatidyltransferase family protein [Croceicoccus sp. YJ47]
MADIILTFSGTTTAQYRVAGLPAVARALHAVARIEGFNGTCRCIALADPDWTPDERTRAECARLAPHVAVTFDGSAAAAVGGDVIDGETLVMALAEGVADRAAFAQARSHAARGQAATLRDLRRAGRRIVAATGKAGDGIVSRYLNRPMSQAITNFLLRMPGLSPNHATLGTAFLALCMFAALVGGGEAGAIAGAVLFQAASVFDGVDGEMARATFRTSRQGATLDSMVDAMTNLAFLIGLIVAARGAGDVEGAVAGGMTLIALALGLALMGGRARANGEPIHFDVVKKALRHDGKSSLVVEAAIRLTMRDFLALAGAVMVLAGFMHALLIGAAVVALVWLVVTLAVLVAGVRGARPRPSRSAA